MSAITVGVLGAGLLGFSLAALVQRIQLCNLY